MEATTLTSPEPLPLLVRRCLAGEQDAMVALVDRFQNGVFGLCLRMLGHRQDAEDAAQETFHRALRYLHNWDSTTEFSPWLLAIAGNRCRTALSKRAKRYQVNYPLEEVADQSEQDAKERLLNEEVRHALATIRTEYRQAFVLFHEEQFSYEEIAAALGCPLGTVKTWVHRARHEVIDRLRRREVVGESRHAV